MNDDHVARARLAYETFRGGCNDITKVPHWDKTPGWVRDAVLVAYLQGRLDAPRPFYGAECPDFGFHEVEGSVGVVGKARE